jgi:phosphate/phosphite/phosphonate ABC transporter binding protein
VVYDEAHQALSDAGIARLTWAVTPFVTQGGSVDERYQPTAAIIAERLAIPIRVIAGESYADVESLLLRGQVDIAVMSPYAYVRARAKDPNIRAIATHIASGTESYGAYILTREDADIHSLSDLRGKPFGFVDQRSSSGWLFPAARLLDAGINPLEDIQGYFFGSHAAVIAAVASGEVAAGATYTDALKAGRGSIPGAKQLRVIARTKRIPYDAYVVRAGFPVGAILGLQQALSSISTTDAKGRKALLPLDDINGFVPADDAHYRSVREVEARVATLIGLAGSTLPAPVPKDSNP